MKHRGEPLPPLTYPLRGIPRDAWRKAQLRAMKDGYALRHVLLAMLEEYAAERHAPERRLLERYRLETDEAKRKGAAKRRKRKREGKR